MENLRIKSNNCGMFTVVKYKNARNIFIVFDGYDEKIKTTAYHALKGSVKNPMKRTLYGVGFIGLGEHKTKYNGKHTACYKAWNHMIERCYYDSFHSTERYKGRGITVCDEWHCYQNFADWYYKNHIEGYELDKDILNQYSSEYNPDNCIFVPQSINKLFTGRKKCRGHLPIGVSTRKNCASYIASCNNSVGKSVYIGSFKTIDEAFSAYKSYKKYVIESVAIDNFKKGIIDKKIFDALMKYEIVPYPA